MEHDGSDGHIAAEDEISRQNNNEYHPDLLNEILNAIEKERRPTGRHLIFGHIILYLPVSARLGSFSNERFDDRNRID